VSVGLVLFLLLGIYLCYRRRKRSANKPMAGPWSLPVGERNAERDSLVSNPYFPAYSRHASTAPMVATTPSFAPTTSPSELSLAAMGQLLPSEPRRTGETTIPITTSGQSMTIPAATSGYNSAVPIHTSGYDTAVSVTTSGRDATIPVTTADSHNTALPQLIVTPPPMYRNAENIAQIPSGRASFYDVRISDFCTTNRDLIPPSLERKLHAARYLPEDDPSDLSAEYWHSTYGVEFFELRRLQAAYERFVNFTLKQSQKRICCDSLFSRHRATQAFLFSIDGGQLGLPMRGVDNIVLL